LPFFADSVNPQIGILTFSREPIQALYEVPSKPAENCAGGLYSLLSFPVSVSGAGSPTPFGIIRKRRGKF
jgi:hypothetical protein